MLFIILYRKRSSIGKAMWNFKFDDGLPVMTKKKF